jgi:hypothetical protein
MRSVFMFFDRLMCQHEFVTARTSGRLHLRCAKCGYETPGVDVSTPLYQRTFDGDAARLQIERKWWQ